MAYRSYFRSVLNDNSKILTWVLILFIAITPNFIFMQSARAAVGGWNLSNAVAQGASTVYDATKNVVINGKQFIKESSVKITPTVTSVSKVLVRSGAGYALSVAVEQLIGAVDWVLDPANNSIKWTEVSDYQYTEGTKFGFSSNPSSQPFLNAEAACLNWMQTSGRSDTSKWQFSGVSNVVNYTPTSGSFMCNATYIQTGNKNRQQGYFSGQVIEQPKEEEKSIPLDVVAQQVISNAAGGDTAAQQATTAAAADIVAEAENDNTKARPIVSQAEANATTKPADAAEAEKANEATGEAKPNAANPEATDLALEFPLFCNWAPVVCEAAQSAVNFMNDFEPDSESGEVTIHEDNNIIFDDSQRINFSSSCPSPEQFSVSFFGASQNLEFSYQPLCDFMSMIKPFVVGGAYLIGAYIVMGLSRGSAE